MITKERRKEIDSMLETFIDQEYPLTKERYPQRMCAMLAGILKDVLLELDSFEGRMTGK